jgi:hypothetical protein
MSKCNNCGGDCGSCTGCGSALSLTEEEIKILEQLGQVAFLPVGRTMTEEAPIYYPDGLIPEELGSLVLQCLEKKGLITLDYDQCLKGFDYGSACHKFYQGSIGLTLRGQQVLELLEIQGIGE